MRNEKSGTSGWCWHSNCIFVRSVASQTLWESSLRERETIFNRLSSAVQLQQDKRCTHLLGTGLLGTAQWLGTQEAGPMAEAAEGAEATLQVCGHTGENSHRWKSLNANNFPKHHSLSFGKMWAMRKILVCQQLAGLTLSTIGEFQSNVVNSWS